MHRIVRCLVCLLIAAGSALASSLLYESNENGNTVDIFTTGGQAIGTLSPALPFSTPYVTIADGFGDIYVGDYSNGRVVEFAPDGSQLATFTAGLGNPGGLALDAEGDLYVVDRSDGNILMYSGGAESVIASVAGARGLAYYGGFLYTASSTSGQVSRFGTDGSGVTTVASAMGDGNLRGVAFDAAGDMFVSNVDNGSIYELAVGASSPTLFASGLSGPEYMAIDASGTLYVPDYYGGNIVLVSATGVDEGVLISGLDHPSSVALVDSPEPAYTAMAGTMILFLFLRARRTVD